MNLPPDLPLLLRALRDPSQLAGLPPAAWDTLLRQAETANLSATLHDWLARHAMLARALPAAREQLEWSAVLARRHRQATYWELRLIGKVLAGLGVPLLLLKGGAYAAAGLPPAAGRLFSDIDILVPEERLPQVEAALMMHGWATTHHDAYDQRYYREWMHELPPMVHALRQTAIDVHHNILPRSAARPPDARLLHAAARPVPELPGAAMLAPADMVLHSATHLFADGEFDKGLRDLWDLHCLLQHFSAHEPGFWDGLPARAGALHLQRYLFYGLRYCQALLGTPVPAAALAALAQVPGARPAAPLLPLMDALFLRALLPHHPSCRGAGAGLADFLLYMRGNWLRMPPLRLARHLFHKAFLSPRKERENPA